MESFKDLGLLKEILEEGKTVAFILVIIKTQ